MGSLATGWRRPVDNAPPSRCGQRKFTVGGDCRRALVTVDCRRRVGPAERAQRGALTTRLKVRVAVSAGVVESVTWMVTWKLPDTDGCPEI